MSNQDGKAIMGSNIKRLIKQNNITAAQLAAVLGVSTATVSDWSNGKTYPRIDKIEAMASYFQIQKADLVEDPQAVSAFASDDPQIMLSHFGVDASTLPANERQRIADQAKAYIQGQIDAYRASTTPNVTAFG